MTISTNASDVISWVGSSGSTYELYKSLVTWSDASAFAASRGGYLVKVDSASENGELFSKLNLSLTAADLDQSRASDGGGASYVWLGASDVLQEGSWIWERDSSSLSTTRDEWGEGLRGTEPDNFSGSQHYLALGMENWQRGVANGQGYGDAGEWNDIAGSNRLYFIVEFDQSPATTDTDSSESNETTNADRLNEQIAGVGSETFQGESDKIDVVIQTGNLTNFGIQKVGDTVVLTDNSGSGGTDTLVGIERVTFSDKAIAFDTDGATSAGGIYRLYKATFNREPDSGGLGYWIAQADAGNKDAVRMAEDFVWSQEFQDLYDITTTDNYGTSTNVRTLVTGFYENVLGRTPDQGGLDYYTGVIGTKEKTVGRVLAEISDSQENYDGTIELIANGIVFEPTAQLVGQGIDYNSGYAPGGG